jgi:hypothetical protein
MNKHIRLLERTYLLILVTIFLLIVFTPYIIHSGFTVFEEQLVEAATIILLFTVGMLYCLYTEKKQIGISTNSID